MATVDQILELRRLINELTEESYTDAVLATRIDASESLQALSAVIWREKAATLAGLVDVREGNSDRKLSQLYKQALEMAVSFEAQTSAEVVATRRGSRTRPIERP